MNDRALKVMTLWASHFPNHEPNADALTARREATRSQDPFVRY